MVTNMRALVGSVTYVVSFSHVIIDFGWKSYIIGICSVKDSPDMLAANQFQSSSVQKSHLIPCQNAVLECTTNRIPACIVCEKSTCHRYKCIALHSW